MAPGQIRDKSWFTPNHRWPSEPLRAGIQWPALPLTQRRRRGRVANQKKGRKLTAAGIRRRLHLEEVNRELDQIVAEFHAAFPRELAVHIGAIYARYSSEFQDSVADQVRALLKYAIANGIFVPREFIFIDLAEKGACERRPGLTQLREALASKRFQVLLVFASSRLFRKAHKIGKLVEEEIVERGLRCVFVKQGIDTANKKQWRTAFQIFSAMDEAYAGMYAENIRAAHLGLAGKGQVYSTIPVGYCGEPIEGQFTKRHRPRCRLAIDEAAAEYVRRIFHSFVDDLLTIDEIVRRLNDDPSSPEPPKSLEGDWTHKSVVGLLMNSRYRAEWPCIATETTWLSQEDYARQYPRDEPLGVFTHEHLRIVSDEIWFKAQLRLQQNATRRGRKPGNSKRKPSSRLLNGILFCPSHDRMLYVGGNNSQSFYCKDCRETVVPKRSLFTLLPYDLAARRILKAIRDILIVDDDLVSAIVTACQQTAERLQQPDPSREAQLRAKDSGFKKSIEFALRNPGQTPAEEKETEQLVRQLRKERSEVQAEIGLLEAARKRQIRIPTPDEVKAELTDLDRRLAASEVGSPDEQGLARGIIELVTGGQINLVQMGQRVKGQGWLQGTFECDLVGIIASRLAGQDVTPGDSATSVAIDFREPSTLDEQANRAKELDDSGILRLEIGRELRCSKSKVTKLLRHWHESRGMPFPDGRSRRSGLTRKHQEPPLYQRIADRVMEGFEKKRPLQDIAAELDVDRNIITATIRFWHESRGLAVPDGRSRRKSLPRRGKSRRRVEPS